MKKQFFLSFLAALLLLLCSCADPDASAAASTAQTLSSTGETVPEIAFSYAQLQYTDFLFSSGAGAWGTKLHIDPDGTFSGIFHDTEMGDTGEGYDHGTVYYCDFYGQLGEPVRVNEFTYRLPLQVLRYGHVPDSQEIIDRQRYCYTTARGIEGTQELLLYLPGAALDALPEAYLQWAGLLSGDVSQLPFWGLYNEAQGCGFSSSDRIQSARDAVKTAEEVEHSVNSLLDEASTQLDMNIAAQQRYLVWDDALNELWEVLKQVLSREAMAQLTKEQRRWIEEKEKTAEEEAAPFLDGSLYPTVYYTTAADLTKERVYCLLDYLP